MTHATTATSSIARLVTLAGALLLAAPAIAQPAQPAPPTETAANSAAGAAAPLPAKQILTVGDPLPQLPGDTWNLRAQVRAWYVGASGDLQLSGATSQKVDVRDLQVDQPRIRPYGELNLQSGPLLLTLSGASASSGQSSVFGRTATVGTLALTPGTPIDARLSIDLVQASVGYRVFTYLFDDRGDNVIRIHALGGIRAWNVESTVTSLAGGGGTARLDRSFINGYAGIKAGLQLVRTCSLEVEVNAGAGSGTSAEIAAGFSWRPVEWGAIEVGYRAAFLNGIRGDGAGKSGFEGKLAGLFFGVVLRF